MTAKEKVIQRLDFMASHYEQMGGSEQAGTLRAAIRFISDSDDKNDSVEFNALEHKCNELKASLRLLSKDLVALADESTGVAGWHLNGDIAKWDEFEGMMKIARVAL
ncbi:hypothetical protein [Idiomarina sp.]|uniref:hypothetical protein n=1 Tax=Idiomarina sp. TaxID=1874361 RepID=UPI0025BEE855|nr:hypothetical protein [Idiomarina sp.]